MTVMSPSPIAKLLALAEQLPNGLMSDWQDTNHFELTSDGDPWIDLSEFFWDSGFGEYVPKNPCTSVDGKNIGLLLDIAEALKAAEPELRAALIEGQS